MTASDILGYGPIADDLELGRLGLLWGYAYVFADHPDKPYEGEAGGELMETSVTYNTLEAFARRARSCVIANPYLVPGPIGMALFRELRGRDVAITLMTNSLARPMSRWCTPATPNTASRCSNWASSSTKSAPRA